MNWSGRLDKFNRWLDSRLRTTQVLYLAVEFGSMILVGASV
jgi:hypothetical protein